jgi:pimeloyl-ACP methyl ester carboxylesterase
VNDEGARPAIDRRKVLAAAAVLPASAVAAPAPRPATFVLVHGAFHGGWCWRLVADRLRGLGHTVFTPTLTGLGERKHLATCETDLRTHFQDVANVIEYEELTQVVLVGHSYGGRVITGAAALAPERIGKLVYLDAIVPTIPVPEGPARARDPDICLVEPIVTPALFGIPEGEVEARAWVMRRLTAHPARSFGEAFPADLTPPDRPRLYIACTDPPSRTSAPYIPRIKGDPSWTYTELATGHDAMITAPEAVTKILVDWAQVGPGAGSG